MPTPILLHLSGGFALGDSVQFTIVLKHLKKYRPDWVLDCCCPEDYAFILAPFCHRVFGGDTAEGSYASVIQLTWGDCFSLFPDRPSTKVAYTLKHVFGIDEYDPELGSYELEHTDESASSRQPRVVLHAEGRSYKDRKNLSVGQLSAIVDGVENVGLHPVMASNFRDLKQMIAAIADARAFIGIDSGPSKVASATRTPTLVVWTGHHPLRYHDPAPNTTHLVPVGWVTLPPFDGLNGSWSSPSTVWREAYRYFANNYKFITYQPGELAKEACRWLKETLRV